MKWFIGCLAKQMLLVFLFLLIVCNIYGDSAGSSGCPGDEWSPWEECEGCLPNKRRVCKTNSSIFEEEECKIGN